MQGINTNILYASNIGYYPDGGTANHTFNTGVTATIQRNARQLPSNITYSLGGNTLFSEAYVYDADANLTRITDLVNGKNNQTLGYDGLNRLTSAVAPNNWGTESFTYDPLNNIRTHVTAGLTLSFNYDGYNRLASETQGSPTGGGFANFQYDARGNQTQSNVVFTSTPHTFDAKNQMLQIPGVATYSYDEAGRRIKKVLANGQTSYFFYSQAGQLLYEYNATAAQPTDYVYLNGKLIARYLSGQNPTDLLTDRQGTPVREVDFTGAVAQSFSYRPFGQLYSGPSQQQPGYTGHVLDPESNLNYMQARYQDGGLGQFLSVDPVVAVPGDVLSFNRYDYANNNPLMHTDPTGKCIEDFCIGEAIAACVATPCGAAVATGAAILAVAAVNAIHDTESYFKQESRSRPPPPLTDSDGKPIGGHSIPDGKGGYTTYPDGNANNGKQYRPDGKPHGDIDRPNVKEWQPNPRNPNGGKGPDIVRKPTPDEIPSRGNQPPPKSQLPPKLPDPPEQS